MTTENAIDVSFKEVCADCEDSERELAMYFHTSMISGDDVFVRTKNICHKCHNKRNRFKGTIYEWEEST